MSNTHLMLGCRKLSAVIFDFDGLMVDTESSALRWWEELYASYGVELPMDQWRTMVGTWDAKWDPRTYLDEQVGRKLDWDTIPWNRTTRDEVRTEPLLPGVAGLIEDALAARVRLAIASSSGYDWVHRNLDRLGVAHHFEVWTTRNDVPRTKPDPALFTLALERLGIPPQEAFALEDSVHGVESAKAAGLKVVAVPGPLMVDEDFSAADLRLDTLEGQTLASLAEQLAR